MLKRLSTIIVAWAVIAGDKHLTPISADKPFCEDYKQYSSVSQALGYGAPYRRVNVPDILQVNGSDMSDIGQ